MSAEVHAILEQVRSDNGKNHKLSVLKANKENTLFKRLLQVTYSPLIRFGISLDQVPEFTPSNDTKGIEWALNELTALSSRQKTGNAGKEHLKNILESLDSRDADAILMVIDSSLKLGCNTSTINSAFGRNTVPETPYMGAVSFNQKHIDKLFASESYLYSQRKEDGRFANIAIIDGSVSIESRQGLPCNLIEAGALKGVNVFESLSGLQGIVLNGELLVSGIEDRYTANGMVSSLISISDSMEAGKDIAKDLTKFEKRFEMTFDKAIEHLYVKVWDYIPYDIYLNEDSWDVSYETRFNNLSAWISDNGLDCIKLVETRIVKSEQEAKAHFVELLQNGYEGTILKSAKAGWVDGKKNHQIKFKVKVQVELKVTGGNYGATGTKNEHLISSINAESECGQLKVSPSGLKEDDMKNFTDNLEQLVGSVISVECCGLSQDKTGAFSLLHPVFLEIRDDKSVADDLAQCIAINEASIGLGSVGNQPVSAKCEQASLFE